MVNRKTGLDFVAFSYQGSAYVGDVINAELVVSPKTAEGKAINEQWAFPVLTGTEWQINAQLQLPSTLAAAYGLMGSAAGATPTGTLLLSTGAGAYAGTAVITSARHRMERDNIQTFDITLAGRGALSVT